MVVATETEEVTTSLGDVLYKSLRGTFRSIIRWLLKCSDVSPPPAHASDLIRNLEQTNLTDVVVHPTDHTPFFVSISLFIMISFVVFYFLVITYTWISLAMRGLLSKSKEIDDPSNLPIVQPDQMGYGERPPTFKVKMNEPVHVHLVESTKQRLEASFKKTKVSIRDSSARGKVEAIVEIPVQTTIGAMPLLNQIPEKDLQVDATQDSVSSRRSGSGKTIDLPPTTTSEGESNGGGTPATKREAGGGGGGEGYDDLHLNSSCSSEYLKELARTPTMGERKALSIIFGDSDEEKEKEKEKMRGLRRRLMKREYTTSTPITKRTPIRSPQLEMSFREPSEYELSLGARYVAGAEVGTRGKVMSPPSIKKLSAVSKVSTPPTSSEMVAPAASSDNLNHPIIGLLPLNTDCATRAGCRECQLQPLQAVLLRWSDANSQTVYVTGSFVNWNSKIPMRRDRVGWVVDLRLPRGHHEYRFIVDGKWELDRGRMGTIHSAQKGVVNHIVHVN